jgi:hypothetical protein
MNKIDAKINEIINTVTSMKECLDKAFVSVQDRTVSQKYDVLNDVEHFMETLIAERECISNLRAAKKLPDTSETKDLLKNLTGCDSVSSKQDLVEMIRDDISSLISSNHRYVKMSIQALEHYLNSCIGKNEELILNEKQKVYDMLVSAKDLLEDPQVTNNNFDYNDEGDESGYMFEFNLEPEATSDDDMEVI